MSELRTKEYLLGRKVSTQERIAYFETEISRLEEKRAEAQAYLRELKKRMSALDKEEERKAREAKSAAGKCGGMSRAPGGKSG